MKRMIAAALCAVMCLSLAACAGSPTGTPDPGVKDNGSIVAKTNIMDAETLAERDNANQPEPTEEPVEETEPAQEPETSTPEPEKEFDIDALTAFSYRYQDFLFAKAGKHNAVFSGEALLSSIDTWRNLIRNPDAEVLKKYTLRDYLNFSNSSSAKLVRSIWVDDSISLDMDKIPSQLQSQIMVVDMDSPDATVRKNEMVANETGRYVAYTQSMFDNETLLDIESVMFIRDGWATGPKAYDSKTRIFYNADGSETKTVMLRDEGLTYWDLGNAVAYCMNLANGDYFMAIVPNKGIDIKTVDVSQLIAGELPSKKAHVRFYMPEFSVESYYKLKLSDFMLPTGKLIEGLFTGVPDDFVPVFYQSVKTHVNHSGVGIVDQYDAGEWVQNNYDDDLDVINIVCDRPFMYYIGDSENEDVAFFGIINEIPQGMAVQLPEAEDVDESEASEEGSEVTEEAGEAEAEGEAADGTEASGNE